MNQRVNDAKQRFSHRYRKVVAFKNRAFGSISTVVDQLTPLFDINTRLKYFIQNLSKYYRMNETERWNRFKGPLKISLINRRYTVQSYLPFGFLYEELIVSHEFYPLLISHQFFDLSVGKIDAIVKITTPKYIIVTFQL